MQRLFPQKRWNIKPPLGAQINWGHPRSQGLVFLALLNENGGISPIDSVAAQNSTMVNPAGWVPSLMGSALKFDGTTHLKFLGNTLVNFSGPLTVEVWFFPTISTAYQCLVSKNTAQAARDFSIFLTANNTASIYLEVGGSGQPGDVAVSPGWATNVWNHVVLTADGTNLRVYLKGQLANTTARTDVATSAGTILDIGREGTISFPLTGNIGKVAIYRRALRASEVRELWCDPYCLMQPQVSLRYWSVPASVAMRRNSLLAGLGASGPFFQNPLN